MIYLDNAATTKMDASVYEKMLPYFQKQYGNPSAIYQFAAESKNAITDARDEIASFLQVKPETIYFTSGGSESDNWALTKVAEANIKKGKHVITSCIEHHAILHTAGFLEKMGFEVTYLPVGRPVVILFKIFLAISSIEEPSIPDSVIRSLLSLIETQRIHAFVLSSLNPIIIR